MLRVRFETYVQADASDRADLAGREWGKDLVDSLNPVCLRPRFQHRRPTEDANLHLLAVAHRLAHVELRIDRLTDEDRAAVSSGDEPDETYTLLVSI